MLIHTGFEEQSGSSTMLELMEFVSESSLTIHLTFFAFILFCLFLSNHIIGWFGKSWT